MPRALTASPRSSFKLALIQLYVEPGHSADNLSRALDLIDQAARGGAEVALLPEGLPFGWMDPSSEAQAEPLSSGNTYEMFRRAAIRHRMFVCTGLVERAANTIFNAAILLD